MPRQLFVLVLFCALLFVAGCGPENGAPSREELSAETKRIAQEFNTTQDLSSAQTQMAALDVANTNQWLVYVTETSIADNSDLGTSIALVKLASAMGLETAAISTFAQQNNLVAQTAPEQEAVINIEPKLQPLPAAGSVAAAAGQASQAEANAPAAPDTAAADAESQENAEAPAPAATEPAAEEPTQEETQAEEVQAEEPTAAPAPPAAPSATAVNGLNVRGGPGIAYNIVGAMEAGTTADLLAKNPQGDWWQVTLPTGIQGWVFGALVTTAGDTSTIAVAANIPAPPPTPEPVAVAPTAAPAAEPAPAETQPEPAPDTGGVDFRLIDRRLWTVEENGGRMDGPSVVCGEKRELRVKVIDAGGNPLNGVAVQEVYGAKAIEVTGAQGKGDGIAEFILGDGQDVKVIRWGDRDVTSDVATNLTTKPYAIDTPLLIQAGFCTDDASCQKNIVDPYACGGHYSYHVVFQAK